VNDDDLCDINDSDLDLLLEDLKVLDEEDISDSDTDMKWTQEILVLF
jgi:hypothetical protein